MAYIPEFVKNSDLSSTTLNAIGEDIGVGVTVVQDDLETLHNYGKVVLGSSVMQNQFLSSLVNRIARAEYTSRAFRSPLAVLKKGILEFGEAIEEIFVEIQRGVARNENLANPSNPFATKLPDVKAAFHLSNLRCKYQTTVRNVDLRKAFLNFSGVDDLIARIVETVYTEHNYDEYLMTKYVLARRALERIAADKYVDLSAYVATNDTYAKAILRNARKFAKLLPIIKTEYNIAGVHTHTPLDKLVCFMTADASSIVDVDALAGAFNMEKAEFVGRIIDVDTFTFTADEIARICAISDIDDVENFPINSEGLTALESIPCVLADEDMLQIYDTIEPRFTEQYNASDDYWNYFLHIDQVFSTSPFMNIIVFSGSSFQPTPTANSVTLQLTHCTASNEETSVETGSSYENTITYDADYVLDSVSVTMGDEDITDSAVVTSSGSLAVSIAEVTGDIVITVSCVEAVVEYEYSATLVNCTSQQMESSGFILLTDLPFTARVDADTDYEFDIANISVRMGETDITDTVVTVAQDKSYCEVNIAELSDNLSFTFEATAVTPGP